MTRNAAIRRLGGARSRKAPICCGPTSPTGAISSCGEAYIQLTQAEAAFRIQKDQLNVRPIWHQREDRNGGPHALQPVFSPSVLWKSLEMWQCARRSRKLAANDP